MTDKKDWRSLFVGREAELAWMQNAWEKAQSGQPQFRVLRGESGLGKTKIVQELYAWLSRTDVADLDEYWPAQLIAGDNLRLNPDLETQALGDNMHYLWWGLRWLQPEAHNQGELTHCAFFDQRQMLRPHWQNLSTFKDTASATLKLGGEVGSIALDLAKDAAVNLFPLLGIIKTVADVGEAVRDFGRAAGGVRDEFERRRKTPAQREAEELAEQIKQIVTFLGWVLKPFLRSGSGSMPVVLVLDDAQWIDARSLAVVHELFDQALENKWPLLIVATHWEREWHEALTVDKTPADIATDSGEFTSFATLYESLALTNADACALLDLTRLREEATILQTAFPGLTPEQIQMLANRADGNPRLLTEIILYLESEPSLFEAENLNGPLDDIAMEELELEMSGFKLNQLQESRYKKLPTEIRNVLALASMQGVRFLADLVNEQSRSAGLSAPSAAAASLGKAENPHAIISSSGLEREFRFAIFHDSAKRFFPRLCRLKKLDVNEISVALLDIATARLGSDYYWRLSDSEREHLLLIPLQSGNDQTRGYVRALWYAADHYRKSGHGQRMGELLKQLQELSANRIIPFSHAFTELTIEYTPFYSGWVVFSLNDYDLMPSTLVRYATDGSEYHQLDGSAECLVELNQAANARIDDLTVMNYLRFYFANVCFEDGVSEMIESADMLADVEPAVFEIFAPHLRDPKIIWNNKTGEGSVNVLLGQQGSLFDVELKLDATGRVSLVTQTLLADTLPQFRNYHWQKNVPDPHSGRGASKAILNGAVRPAMTMALAKTMLEEVRRILGLTEVASELLAPWIADEVEVRIFDTTHDVAMQPRDSRVLYVGVPRYRVLTMQRLTLLVAFTLLEEYSTRKGLRIPTIKDTKDDYISQFAIRKAEQIAHLCAIAYDLSIQKEFADHDFIGEMHAMGHGEAMDVFVSA